MISETRLGLAEKFRQNWQTQYPCSMIEKSETRNFHQNFLKRNNRNFNQSFFGGNHNDNEDDSLTNLNWLQNLNLFNMSQTQPPLSPSPTHQMTMPSPQFPLSMNPMNQLNRIIPQYFESSSLYAEVAMNLEFMNDEASVHFFRMNNQLRPPFSDINLISMAIHSYNKMKVSFPEICQWIEETFPYYKSLSDDWKTGIKNHLTLSKCFQKVPRRRDETEKGGFWRFSNEFLNYLERNRIQTLSGVNFDNRINHDNANPSNDITYKFGKIINRKRTMNKFVTQDENENSAFRIPKKKWFSNEMIDFQNGKSILIHNKANNNSNNMDNIHHGIRECKPRESLLLQYQDGSLCNINQMNLAINSCANESMSNIGISVLANSDLSRLQESNELFHQNIMCNQINPIVTASQSPCPEQVTEEEFLSGQAFTNNYITLNTNADSLPSMLDTQTNYSHNDFNISDLSITGIGLKPPEWWNQSFSASQISLSKFNCSFRSVTVANNGEQISPFCIGIDEDHHGLWSSNDISNLSELDVLFGLS
uniref:Forkhead box J1-5 n=1 Tax=Schmidtea mediterranea TaxID=79327 RepID=A0A823A376_SCHMD|nr:TPA_exp: forkhead box J1-5 [Schmidtea mediterranea]